MKLTVKFGNGKFVAVIIAQIDIERGTPLTLHYGSGYWRYVLKNYANFDANQRRAIEKHILDFPDNDNDDDDDDDYDVF